VSQYSHWLQFLGSVYFTTVVVQLPPCLDVVEVACPTWRPQGLGKLDLVGRHLFSFLLPPLLLLLSPKFCCCCPAGTAAPGCDLQLDAAHVCYLVAGVTPTPLDAGPAARMLLLGVNHTTTAGQRAMRQALPLMRSEVYEWARLLAGTAA